MTKINQEKWRNGYFFAGGFALCLAIFGIVVPAVFIGLGIACAVYADKKLVGER